MEETLKARAEKIIARRRAEAKDRLEARRREVFAAVPEIAEIEREFDAAGIKMVNCILDGSCDPETAVRRVMAENRLANDRKRRLLTENGYAPEYIDPLPLCSRCNDSGYDGSSLCGCVRAELNRELASEANLSDKMKEQTFETFRFDYYSDAVNPALGISNRDNMKSVYRMTKDFAENFEQTDKNLFFTGGCGLGKTFLSSAVANLLAEKGTDVLYVSANSLFPLLEDLHFNREVSEKNMYLLRHINDCELLILDDLGAEFVTPFTSAELFRIINSRLAAGKNMIISTNMSLGEVKQRYSERIYSRIAGSFDIVGFFGEDIRRIVKMEEK